MKNWLPGVTKPLMPRGRADTEKGLRFGAGNRIEITRAITSKEGLFG